MSSPRSVKGGVLKTPRVIAQKTLRSTLKYSFDLLGMHFAERNVEAPCFLRLPNFYILNAISY